LSYKNFIIINFPNQNDAKILLLTTACHTVKYFNYTILTFCIL